MLCYVESNLVQSLKIRLPVVINFGKGWTVKIAKQFYKFPKIARHIFLYLLQPLLLGLFSYVWICIFHELWFSIPASLVISYIFYQLSRSFFTTSKTKVYDYNANDVESVHFTESNFIIKKDSSINALELASLNLYAKSGDRALEIMVDLNFSSLNLSDET